MKLKEIVRIVSQQMGVAPEDVFENLAVIRGRDYWGDAESGWLWDGDVRRDILDPEMVFDEPFMLFEYIGHYPMACLFFLESHTALETSILSEGGIFNHFTTAMYAFIYGQLSNFECYYRDKDGHEHIFEKDSQTDDFSFVYDNRRLKWL
jgi:hypothetical protein